MKLLQMIDYSMAPTSAEPALKPYIEGYLAHAQVQPLTDLMVEIITFQWRERALFTEIDMPAYCLN